MIPITKLKKDVSFNTELTQVVDVLKGIAAARYHLLERQLSLFEPFFQAAGEILAAIDVRTVQHPFVQVFSPVTAVLMVTSDGGFLGGLNTQVVNAGVHAAGNRGLLTVIGERGAGYISDLHLDCTAFPGITDGSRYSQAVTVGNHLIRQLLAGQCGKIVVTYPKPTSFSTQEVVSEVLLPCSAWIPQGQVSPDIVWESRMEDVLQYLVSYWVARRLDEVFALSRLAELSARVVHLEGSYQELVRRGKKLKQEYFRVRHEIIDRSMREIFAAQLLYRRALEEKAAAHETVGAEREST